MSENEKIAKDESIYIVSERDHMLHLVDVVKLLDDKDAAIAALRAENKRMREALEDIEDEASLEWDYISALENIATMAKTALKSCEGEGK